MKIRHVSIDGYGRFSGLSLDFSPGLQVIIGPNEKGKSTIRSFIGDMLYGQRKGLSSPEYDESKTLRLPWSNPDCYGGRLVYELSDGKVFEVIRNFDPERETVQILDPGDRRDLSAEFDRLRNGEIDFAAQHLGLSKDVFINTATISHFSLDDLGGQDALDQIREKLLSLADSGDETASAGLTIERIEARIEAIGRPGARSRPLPRAKARLVELDEELVRLEAITKQLESAAAERRTLVQETAEMRKRRIALEEDLKTLDRHERLDRLRDAESLRARIETATQHCAALAGVREFPLERLPEVERIEQKLSHAREQLGATHTERKALARQLEEERRAVGNDTAREYDDLPEDLEERLNAAISKVQQAAEYEQGARDGLESTESRLRDAQLVVAELPDFSRVAPDPMEYLSQLGNAFEVARRERDLEKDELEKILQDIRRRQKNIADSHALFKERLDFPELAREYELSKRVHEEKLSQRQSSLQALQSAQAEIEESNPGFRWLAFGCTFGLVIFLGLYLYTSAPGILIAMIILFVAAVFFGLSLTFSQKRLKEVIEQIEEAKNDIQSLELEDHTAPGPVEELLQKSGLESLRELEALYDQYREASLDLTARVAVMREQESKNEEAASRIPQLLERLRATFTKIDEQIENEADVAPAIARSITKYQQYREAKRSLTESRAQLDRQEAECKRRASTREAAEAELGRIEEELRRFLRENGYEEERRHDTALAALRAYRTRSSRIREHRGRAEVLYERLQNMERKEKNEELELEKLEQELGRLLAHAGVSQASQFHALAEQAREYQEIWTKRAALEEQLEQALKGETIDALREQGERIGVPPERPRRSREQILAELERLNTSIDERMREDHDLHVSLTERAAVARSRNEIEEERARVAHQVEELEREMAAATRAIALIDEIARDKHARIAPRLADKASRYLGAITGGAYDDLRLGRDFTLSIRIPQTRKVNQAPEKSLSKGTVDQIYLALRLALVQCLSENGEAAPMLLDDPFANYDDARLENTLGLINTMAGTHQILLFTCREDVARAAEAIEAPLLRL